METLTLKDTERLHQSIQEIYTLHDPTTFGLDALTIANQLIPSDIPSFHLTNIQTLQMSSIFQPGFSGLTPAMEAVMRKFYGEHPIAQNMPKALSGTCKISDFINEQEFYRLEGLYQQYLGLFGIEDQMTCFLTGPDKASLVGISLHRSERSFTERDREMLNILRPHFSQAYTNASRYQQLEQNFNQLQQSVNCLGLVIVDTSGQVKSIAPQVEIWLETYFTKSVSPDRLPDHLWSWAKYQIKSLIQPSNLPQASPAMRLQLADRELVIRLVADKQGDRYLLLLEEQLIGSCNSLEILGFSQRETELLRWVIEGEDTKTIAAHMGITTATVRKHLESLYRKLGVTHRSAAIAQVLKKLGLLPVTMMR
jgi:DNA-binding CsgD family transcriptional regulator